MRERSKKMSNALFKIKYNGSFTFVPEEKLITEAKKAHAWFMQSGWGKFCAIIFSLIDFSGFYQLATHDK